MDYSSTPAFDDNPFANEGGYRPPATSRSGFPADDDFHNDHSRIGGSLSDAGVSSGLFGGEDNSPAGGLFSDAHSNEVLNTSGFGPDDQSTQPYTAREVAHDQQHVKEQPHVVHEETPYHEPRALATPFDASEQLADEGHPHRQGEQQQQQSHHHHTHEQSLQQRPEGHSHGSHRRPVMGTVSGGEGRNQASKHVAQYRLQAKVTALERLGRKDPVIKFDVHTNLPKFRTTQFRDVRRTHPEFIKLAEHLLSNNPECFVPAVPPPSTSAGVGTEEDDARVRGTMQRWLNYVCGNEVLMRDEEMMLFVESDSGYSPLMRKKQPATGVRRRVIKQFAPPPDDTPELAEVRPVVKAFYLGTMETGHKVDKVVKARRGLGLAESDLGVKFHNLSTIESHGGMANALRKLGKTIQQVGDYHAAQATAEATTFGDPLQYHSSDAFVVKETLTNRQILQRELQTAQANTRSKESTAARLRAGSSIKKDKSDEAIVALNDARQVEDALTQKVARVTANLLQERRRWFARTSTDLRASIRDYTLRQIEAERRLLSTLEAVRPDVRAIDGSGGLSRLGRDIPPPAARRIPVASSQGPRGDAWSGVPRAGGPRSNSVVGILDAANAPMNGGEGGEAGGTGHTRSRSNASKNGEEIVSGHAEDEDDRLDAKNAASRLATSTF